MSESNNKRRLSLWLGIIIALLLASTAFFAYKYFQQGRRYSQNMEVLNNNLQVWKSKEGKWIAERQALELTSRELRDQVRSLKDAPRIRRIKEIIEIETQTRDTIYLRDTLRWWTDSTLSYNDSWLNFDLNRLDSTLTYEAQDSISFFRYETGGLFKPRRVYIRGISHNPNTKIKGLDAMVIEQKNLRFGIGPSVGVTYDGQWRPYYGVGLHYSLIRF